MDRAEREFERKVLDGARKYLEEVSADEYFRDLIEAGVMDEAGNVLTGDDRPKWKWPESPDRLADEPVNAAK